MAQVTHKRLLLLGPNLHHALEHQELGALIVGKISKFPTCLIAFKNTQDQGQMVGSSREALVRVSPIPALKKFPSDIFLPETIAGLQPIPCVEFLNLGVDRWQDRFGRAWNNAHPGELPGKRAKLTLDTIFRLHIFSDA